MEGIGALRSGSDDTLVTTTFLLRSLSVTNTLLRLILFFLKRLQLLLQISPSITRRRLVEYSTLVVRLRCARRQTFVELARQNTVWRVLVRTRRASTSGAEPTGNVGSRGLV